METGYLSHHRLDIAEPAIYRSLAEENAGIYEPCAAVAKKAELSFQSGVGE